MGVGGAVLLWEVNKKIDAKYGSDSPLGMTLKAVASAVVYQTAAGGGLFSWAQSMKEGGTSLVKGTATSTAKEFFTGKQGALQMAKTLFIKAPTAALKAVGTGVGKDGFTSFLVSQGFSLTVRLALKDSKDKALVEALASFAGAVGGVMGKVIHQGVKTGWSDWSVPESVMEKAPAADTDKKAGPSDAAPRSATAKFIDRWIPSSGWSAVMVRTMGRATLDASVTFVMMRMEENALGEDDGTAAYKMRQLGYRSLSFGISGLISGTVKGVRAVMAPTDPKDTTSSLATFFDGFAGGVKTGAMASLLKAYGQEDFDTIDEIRWEGGPTAENQLQYRMAWASAAQGMQDRSGLTYDYFSGWDNQWKAMKESNAKSANPLSDKELRNQYRDAFTRDIQSTPGITGMNGILKTANTDIRTAAVKKFVETGVSVWMASGLSSYNLEEAKRAVVKLGLTYRNKELPLGSDGVFAVKDGRALSYWVEKDQLGSERAATLWSEGAYEATVTDKGTRTFYSNVDSKYAPDREIMSKDGEYTVNLKKGTITRNDGTVSSLDTSATGETVLMKNLEDPYRMDMTQDWTKNTDKTHVRYINTDSMGKPFFRDPYALNKVKSVVEDENGVIVTNPLIMALGEYDFDIKRAVMAKDSQAARNGYIQNFAAGRKVENDAFLETLPDQTMKDTAKALQTGDMTNAAVRDLMNNNGGDFNKAVNAFKEEVLKASPMVSSPSTPKAYNHDARSREVDNYFQPTDTATYWSVSARDASGKMNRASVSIENDQKGGGAIMASSLTLYHPTRDGNSYIVNNATSRTKAGTDIIDESRTLSSMAYVKTLAKPDAANFTTTPDDMTTFNPELVTFMKGKRDVRTLTSSTLDLTGKALQTVTMDANRNSLQKFYATGRTEKGNDDSNAVVIGSGANLTMENLRGAIANNNDDPVALASHEFSNVSRAAIEGRDNITKYQGTYRTSFAGNEKAEAWLAAMKPEERAALGADLKKPEAAGVVAVMQKQYDGKETQTVIFNSSTNGVVTDLQNKQNASTIDNTSKDEDKGGEYNKARLTPVSGKITTTGKLENAVFNTNGGALNFTAKLAASETGKDAEYIQFNPSGAYVRDANSRDANSPETRSFASKVSVRDGKVMDLKEQKNDALFNAAVTSPSAMKSSILNFNDALGAPAPVSMLMPGFGVVLADQDKWFDVVDKSGSKLTEEATVTADGVDLSRGVFEYTGMSQVAGTSRVVKNMVVMTVDPKTGKRLKDADGKATMKFFVNQQGGQEFRAEQGKIVQGKVVGEKGTVYATNKIQYNENIVLGVKNDKSAVPEGDTGWFELVAPKYESLDTNEFDRNASRSQMRFNNDTGRYDFMLVDPHYLGKDGKPDPDAKANVYYRTGIKDKGNALSESGQAGGKDSAPMTNAALIENMGDGVSLVSLHNGQGGNIFSGVSETVKTDEVNKSWNWKTQMMLRGMRENYLGDKSDPTNSPSFLFDHSNAAIDARNPISLVSKEVATKDGTVARLGFSADPNGTTLTESNDNARYYVNSQGTQFQDQQGVKGASVDFQAKGRTASLASGMFDVSKNEQGQFVSKIRAGSTGSENVAVTAKVPDNYAAQSANRLVTGVFNDGSRIGWATQIKDNLNVVYQGPAGVMAKDFETKAVDISKMLPSDIDNKKAQLDKIIKDNTTITVIQFPATNAQPIPRQKIVETIKDPKKVAEAKELLAQLNNPGTHVSVVSASLELPSEIVDRMVSERGAVMRRRRQRQMRRPQRICSWWGIMIISSRPVLRLKVGGSRATQNF